jgi:hypothetical protein
MTINIAAPSGRVPGAPHIAYFAMCGSCPLLQKHQSTWRMLAPSLPKHPLIRKPC